MMRFAPVVAVIFMGIVSTIPWKSRELGWYGTDIGTRRFDLAPMSPRPKLMPNDFSSGVTRRPILPSNFNRTYSWEYALVIALCPCFVASVFFAPSVYVRPWEYLRTALRSLS